MKRYLFKIFIFLSLGILVSFNEFFVNKIYSNLDRNYFNSIGVLEEFVVQCKISDCEKAYLLPKVDSMKIDGTYSIGVGVLSGRSKWYCGPPQNGKLVYSTGPTVISGKIFRNGTLLYNYINISKEVCSEQLTLIFEKDVLNPSPNIGWMSGPLIAGSPQVVYSYSVLYDFFNSYFRVLLALAIFIVAYFLKNIVGDNRSLQLYFKSIIYLSIFFITTSSLFDLLSPVTGGFGLVVAISSGSSFVLLLLLSDWRIQKSKVKYFDALLSVAPFLFFCILYSLANASLYITFQSIMCMAIFFRSLYTGNLTYTIFSILLSVDITSLYGYFEGFPRGTSAIFLSFKLISDFLSLINVRQEKLKNIDSMEELIIFFKKNLHFFSVKRFSISTISKGHSFKTLIYESKKGFDRDSSKKTFENFDISQLLGIVISTGRSYYRVKVGSDLFYRLTGKRTGSENKEIGSEFCCYPVDYRGRNIGMLSVTNYSKYTFLDVFGLFIFNSYVEYFIEFIGPAIFRHYMSEEVEDKKILDEVAIKHFNNMRDDSDLVSFVDELSSKMNLKIILSTINLEERVFSVKRAFGFSDEISKFLNNRKLVMEDDIAGLGPVNISYHERKELYIYDVKSVLNLYPKFLKNIFLENRTDSLYVSPLGKYQDPWGMLWIEFPDYLKIRPEHIEDLSRSIVTNINSAKSKIIREQEAVRIKKQFSRFVPQRVVDKVSEGSSAREQDEGFLLFIDIVGSTKFSKKIGEENFSYFISNSREKFNALLRNEGFELQMTIWDAFIYTKSKNQSKPSIDSLEQFLQKSNEYLTNFNLHCRIVLHYGDITRDFSETTGRSWTISGAALAEAIKLEEKIKDKKNIILISNDALEKYEESIETSENMFFEDECVKKVV